ncbi:N-acetylglutamate synthase [Cedecea lapagei]|uniref:N-acetylglutamate synthase n=2 Tax=Cedecea lapagei TaxID=158823 RepID=A0A3S4KUG2_9ENTR|nr:N-acetylglutamate synthase [Cedecea lapagei]
MTSSPLYRYAERIRRFNRFYTRQIGVLNEHLLNSQFSLTEVRIMFELAREPGVTTSGICKELNLNAGYLSRVVSGFEEKGLLTRERSPDDARATCLFLTQAGKDIFEEMNTASRVEVENMLKKLSEDDQIKIINAMENIENILSKNEPAYIIRDPRPGDMGMIVSHNGALYAAEYGWNMEFEALVAQIVADFVREQVPDKEKCWIAEKDGKVVGSVFVVSEDEVTAKLRILYVDASARGLGIGNRLVDEAMRFAREAGYKRMILWTNSVQTGARRIYDKAGFTLIEEQHHHSFGKDLVGQVLARDL